MDAFYDPTSTYGKEGMTAKELIEKDRIEGSAAIPILIEDLKKLGYHVTAINYHRGEINVSCVCPRKTDGYALPTPERVSPSDGN